MLSKNTCFNTKTHIGKMPAGYKFKRINMSLNQCFPNKKFWTARFPLPFLKKKRRVFKIIVLFFINQFITRNKNILQRPIDWEQRWADVIIETCSYVVSLQHNTVPLRWMFTASQCAVTSQWTRGSVVQPACGLF